MNDQKAFFLDRDGVINRARTLDGKPQSPKNISQVEILEGVEEAIIGLKGMGYLTIVITNQPDFSRGVARKEDLIDINEFIKEKLAIDAILVCWHDDAEVCLCRKPSPGLIHSAVEQFDISLDSSFLIGDRWKDIAAAQAAGVKPFFIDYKYSEQRPQPPFTLVGSLEACQHLQNLRQEQGVSR